MKYLPLLLITIAYFVAHSFLASKTVKAFVARFFHPKFYRLFFNFSALVSLVPLVYVWKTTHHSYVFDLFYLKITGGFLMAIGIYISIKALGSYDLGEFSGTAQLNQEREKILGNLNTSGMNARVRHPLYFGTLLVIWGGFLIFSFDTVLIVVLVTTLYLYFGTKLEEQKLIEEFGAAYLEYQKKVPMLIPSFQKKR